MKLTILSNIYIEFFSLLNKYRILIIEKNAAEK